MGGTKNMEKKGNSYDLRKSEIVIAFEKQTTVVYIK